ncbi:MAG TPA: hypothetical protein VM934_00755, partial [Pyrinomonadaceae bacterium]|nr:hypothetical protein [Pyrinomonadaceae bacterium]
MTPQRILSILQRRRITIMQILLLFSLVAVCAAGMVSSTAQSTSQEEKAAAKSEERELKKKLNPRLPIKIKVKNLNSEKWVNEFEVEVTNTSTKPIYYLSLILILPEVLSDTGHEIGFPLRYGRMDFVDFKEPIQPTDVPIKPGEKYVLKIPQQLM